MNALAEFVRTLLRGPRATALYPELVEVRTAERNAALVRCYGRRLGRWLGEQPDLEAAIDELLRRYQEGRQLRRRMAILWRRPRERDVPDNVSRLDCYRTRAR